MYYLMMLLFLVSLVFFVIGLFSPKTTLFFIKGERTRGKSALIYGCASIIFMFIGAATMPEDEKATLNEESMEQVARKETEGEDADSRKEVFQEEIVDIQEDKEIKAGTENVEKQDRKKGERVLLDIQGKGNYSSDLFKISRGRTKVRYQVVATEEFSPAALMVYFVDKGDILDEVGGFPSVEVLSMKRSESGETYIRKSPGSYYLEIVAEGSWRVIVSQQ